MLPEVTIGCPVRNRAWILPFYLKYLTELDYPKEKIRFAFLLNDSSDGSGDILLNFKKDHMHEYLSIDLYECNLGTKPDFRGNIKEREHIFKALAEVRNELLEHITSPYFFSVDSDILVPRHALRTLIEDNKKIVAGVIWNDYVARPEATYPNVRSNLLIRVKDDKPGNLDRITHYLNYPLNSLFEVYLTGAVYLLDRDAYTKCRYGFSAYGEDYQFCEDAHKNGFEIWADSRVFCSHVMVVNQMLCKDCGNDCKAYRVYNNMIFNELKECERKIPRKA